MKRRNSVGVALFFWMIASSSASAATLTTAAVPTPDGPTWVACTLMNLSEETISYSYDVISCSSQAPSESCVADSGQTGQLAPGAAAPSGAFGMLGDSIACRFDLPGVKKKDVRAGLCVFAGSLSTAPKTCRIFTEAH
jgi:hypothetical protein